MLRRPSYVPGADPPWSNRARRPTYLDVEQIASPNLQQVVVKLLQIGHSSRFAAVLAFPKKGRGASRPGGAAIEED
jgi:hypothetical protein